MHKFAHVLTSQIKLGAHNYTVAQELLKRFLVRLHIQAQRKTPPKMKAATQNLHIFGFGHYSQKYTGQREIAGMLRKDDFATVRVNIARALPYFHVGGQEFDIRLSLGLIDFPHNPVAEQERYI
jgi:hypothetical protein